MRSSRIIGAAALAVLCISGCSAPSNGPTTPQAVSQTNAANGANQATSADRTAGISPDGRQRLFWRPEPLILKKGAKQTAKVFYEGTGRLRVGDDCTGRVAFDQIGFARIKKHRINIYEALALRSGPFHCGVIAKTIVGPPLRAILHVAVSP